MNKKISMASTLFMGLGQLLSGYKLKGMFFALIEIIFLISLPKFITGIRKFINLGEATESFDPVTLKKIAGDDSRLILVTGATIILLIIFFVIMYIKNIEDAREIEASGIKNHQTLKEEFKGTYDKIFVPLMLTPAALGVIFLIFLPMFVTVLVAFTNFGGKNLMSFDWVGFKNFRAIASFNSNSGTSGGFLLTFLISITISIIISIVVFFITRFVRQKVTGEYLTKKSALKVFMTVVFFEMFCHVLKRGDNTLLGFLARPVTMVTSLFEGYGRALVEIFIWSLVWGVLSTISVYFGGLILALLTNKKNIKFRGMWRTIFILPYAVPQFVSLLVLRTMFLNEGMVNQLLKTNIPFLTDTTNARIMVILLNMWVGAPYFMVLLSGMLTNVSQSQYEAAEIDGASKFQQFTKITFPTLLRQSSSVLVLTFAYNFNNLGAIYLLTGGGPNGGSYTGLDGKTDLLITWLFKLTIAGQPAYNIAAVITIMIFIFVGGISYISFTRLSTFKEEV